MNRPQLDARCQERRWSRFWALPLVFIVAACGVPAEDSAAQTETSAYDVEYTITPLPKSGEATVTMQVRQTGPLLREVRFTIKPERHFDFSGDGEVEVEDDEVRWYVPDRGGELSWRAKARRRKGNNTYDAWLDENWGLLRLERLIPRASTRARRGAASRTVIDFDLPDGWSVVTPYLAVDGKFPVDDTDRLFDKPTGWMVMGPLGVRWDDVAGARIVVAGPQGNSVRRMDIVTFLNWTLPEVQRLVPEPAERVTIVSAGEPMWRGGLAARNSLYIHADRPIISENGTSTILHEVLHVAFGIRSRPGADWIVEGLAEYYTVEILNRSGGLSSERTQRSFASLAEWAKDVDVLCEDPSTGPQTAYAVTLFAALDVEIRSASGNLKNLDDVLEILLTSGERVSATALVEAATTVLGKSPETLRKASLPGCEFETPTLATETE
jgi:hypothetical protein